MMREGRWLAGSLTPEYRADDEAGFGLGFDPPARQAPAWSLGIAEDLAVILCSCGQWWQGDPEDAATGGPGSCRQPGHTILTVITTWEEA